MVATMAEIKPTTETQTAPLRTEWRCDNMVWNRRNKRLESCGHLLQKHYLAPGSEVEIVCKKCGKKHEKVS